MVDDRCCGDCSGADASSATSRFRMDAFPKGFPAPGIPADNPMTTEKVELGRRLFYDKRMSVNGRESCGSCHRQDLRLPTGARTPRGPRANCIRAAA